MESLDGLSKKRTFAKKNFSLNINKIQPLVQQAGAEAFETLQDVKDLMVKVESCFSSFVKSHDIYMESLEVQTTEKDADRVLELNFNI